MEKVDIKAEAKKLIELAVDDLHCARILYTSRKYRNSLLLFQQCVEKANKGFGLFSGMISFEDLKKIGHKPINIYRQPLKKHRENLEQLVPLAEKFPGGTSFSILDAQTLVEHNQHLRDFELLIQKLNGKDILEIPLRDIDTIIDDLISLDEDAIEMPSPRDAEFIDFVWGFLTWIGQIPTDQVADYKAMLTKELSNEDNLKSFVAEFKKIITITNNGIFMTATLMMCAGILNQHGISTRYHEGNFNPIKTYNKNLPIIRRQDVLMNLFEDALKRFKRYVNNNPPTP